jgi:hypothetical protein
MIRRRRRYDESAQTLRAEAARDFLVPTGASGSAVKPCSAF